MTKTAPKSLPARLEAVIDLIHEERVADTFSASDFGIINGCNAILRRMEARTVVVHQSGPPYSSVQQHGWGLMTDEEVPAGSVPGSAASDLQSAIHDALAHENPASLDAAELHTLRQRLLNAMSMPVGQP